MTLEMSDKSSYLKGMLVLFCKDGNINNTDEKTIRGIAEELGFNHYFVDSSINEIKHNKYFMEEPPVFSNSEIAKVFIRDAIRFAFIDYKYHMYEIHWLSMITSKNNLPGKWFLSEIKYFLNKNRSFINNSFEIQKYV